MLGLMMNILSGFSPQSSCNPFLQPTRMCQDGRMLKGSKLVRD